MNPNQETTTIPVVRLTDVVARRPEAMEDLRRAARKWGVFYLDDAGIPSDLIDDVMSMSDRFFGLPDERKQALSLNDRDDFRGYVGLGEELTDGKPDMKESYEFAQDGDRPAGAEPRAFDRLYGHSPWPEESWVPGFRSVLSSYMGRVEEASQRMMAALIDSLDVDPVHRDLHWSELLHYRTRLIHYSMVDDMAEGTIRVAEHTDLATFNLLRINAPGLEARHADGRWVEVAPRPGAFVVILDELCNWWTRGRYHAGVHRVRQVTMEGCRPRCRSSSTPTCRPPCGRWTEASRRKPKASGPVRFCSSGSSGCTRTRSRWRAEGTRMSRARRYLAAGLLVLFVAPLPGARRDPGGPRGGGPRCDRPRCEP